MKYRERKAILVTTLLFAVLVIVLLSIQGVYAMENKTRSVSGLPAPPVEANRPRPAGAPGNLVVLDWAGFKSALTYPFDDGQPSHVAHYLALQETGVPMTFYISSNVNWIPSFDAVWSLAVEDGHEIGNHTASHPRADLTQSSFGRHLGSPEEEIDACTKYIKEHFGQEDVWTMAAPYGDTGWIEPAKKRFFINRGIGMGTIAPNSNINPHNLPCYMAKTGDTAELFNDLIDFAREDGHWLIFCFHTISPAHDNWYAPVELKEITGSIEFAKAFGDIWIDTVANIGAYWAGQKVFNAVTPTRSGDEITWTWTLPPFFPKGKYLRVTVDGGTLKQGDKVLEWDPHGYYEVALDAGVLTLAP